MIYEKNTPTIVCLFFRVSASKKVKKNMFWSSKNYKKYKLLLWIWILNRTFSLENILSNVSKQISKYIEMLDIEITFVVALIKSIGPKVLHDDRPNRNSLGISAAALRSTSELRRMYDYQTQSKVYFKTHLIGRCISKLYPIKKQKKLTFF